MTLTKFDLTEMNPSRAIPGSVYTPLQVYVTSPVGLHSLPFNLLANVLEFPPPQQVTPGICWTSGFLTQRAVSSEVWLVPSSYC
jgi:hypothetical protein